MHNLTPEALRACIQQCWECRDTCQTLFYNHCLVKGGAHVERRHATLMNDCIQICQISADFMTRNSPVHMATCGACAVVCEACAKSCEAIDCEENAALRRGVPRLRPHLPRHEPHDEAA
ncbi:MAG: four-helix bundle copper-binding protein [Asticcacaulis sp.]